MKTISSPALAALDRGDAIVAGAVEIGAASPIRVWSGYGPLTFDGRTFDPVGDRGLVQVAGGALGAAAQAITLTLSGIEPDVLALLDASEVSGAPCILWRLIFDSSGTTLLGYNIWARGRLDTLTVDEEIGGTSTITASLETPARGLGRRGARQRSDADQRLIDAADGFFKNTAFAAKKTLYWGGRKPSTAAEALPGVGAGVNGWRAAAEN